VRRCHSQIGERHSTVSAAYLFDLIAQGDRMYTRTVRVKLRANCANEFKRLLKQQIIPLLRNQQGFSDEITLVSLERNEAIAISFWDNQESADAYNHVAYLDVLRVLSKVIISLPIVETFEVVESTLAREQFDGRFTQDAIILEDQGIR
jgi:hypothetical protein